MNEANTEAIKKSNRMTLYLIFGIPIVVLLMSTVLFFMADAKMVDLGSSNKGQLITPPLPLQDLDLTTAEGQAFDYEAPEPQWTFLTVGTENCDENCRQMLYFTRQAHKASGKMMNEIKRIYLNVSGKSSSELTDLLSREHEGLAEVYVDADSLAQLVGDSGFDINDPYSFYLVDRRGWIMMRYTTTDFETMTLSQLSKDLIKDLKRLMQ